MGYNSVEPYVRELFEWYAPVSHRLRWPLIILPLIVTSCCSVGFLRMRELRIDDPAFVFTPSDARWRRELQTFSDTWPLKETKFLPGKSFEMKRFVNILIKAKDGGNILREPILKEIQMLNQWLMFNISIPTDDRKFNLTYQDLCMSYDWECMANEHIEMLRQRHKVGRVIDLSYPRGGNQDTPVYLGTTLGDVQLYTTNHTVREAKITQLFYFLKQEDDIVARYSSDLSYAAEKFLLKVYKSDLLKISFAHYQSLQDGLDENADRFVPNFVVSFTSLASYALIFSFCLRRAPAARGIDMIRSKPWLAVAGLATTLMSITSGFGFLMILGYNYNVINTIIPFLIIAIGIDDMFIMVACWEQTNPNNGVIERMQATLAHAGVAITITNITDILSFGIGCITDLPGIQLFCLYAAVSVAFCYVYQLTFFCGALAISGNAEEQRRHCVFLYRIPEGKYLPSTVEAKSSEERSKSSRIYPENLKQYHRTCTKSNSLSDFSDIASNLSTSSSGSNILSPSKSCQSLPSVSLGVPTMPYAHTVQNTAHSEPSMIIKWIGEKFGPFLLRDSMRALATFVFLIYLSIALYGCVNFREGLNPGNLVTNDHYIARYFEDIKHFWKAGPQLHVAVLSPPNLIERSNRDGLMSVVSSFENTPYTMGREGTVFFLLEYLNYLDQLNAEVEDTERIWKTKLKSWLKYTGGSSQWDCDIRWNETTGDFSAYRFQIALQNIIEPNQHKLAAKTLREIADRQPFHIEIYYEAFPFADQYLIILPATIQNVGISLLCMTVVSILLVPSLPSGVIIFISIVSINIGVFGYMTLWGVNLDAVSMISIIMSIGFAVDLSAHIIYAFVTSHGDSKERVIGALEALGWPIFQGASSTILGISVLYTVDAYIILTFFKTIWLTMMIGAVHGLFFIPVLLSFIPIGFFRIPKSSELH
ncbi:hypothetical protein PENTCL1PPCAC_28793 [Pristionchus entomophagus]|uniref:SSD domain-containing protein n=1 Tax=Pristionchus entomophagus TaxID=358040 RepID=A0AAV5UI19_9BILA|nr:hypothetical protein PENTCL1PPCAC_28793 [Pristionchus entomophagus]